MKTISISGSLRENVGKRDSKMNRRLGKIPCVIYGGEKQVHFTVDELPFSKLILTPEVYIVKLTINEVSYDAILQDVQYHPVSDRVLHVDFLELTPGKPVIISIPIRIKGVSPGILEGGRLIKKKRKLRVQAMLEFLPDFIELDISPLDIGDSIKIKDLDLENLILLDSPLDMVIAVQVTRIVEEEEEIEGEEEGAEGEEGKGEEGAEATPAKE
ncbi:MAG: 50S ribosomal protein L25 [Bacteroidales bacterium]|nr:50S ribosomal protein L25 [Bacteroidales bacterium]